MISHQPQTVVHVLLLKQYFFNSLRRQNVAVIAELLSSVVVVNNKREEMMTYITSPNNQPITLHSADGMGFDTHEKITFIG